MHTQNYLQRESTNLQNCLVVKRQSKETHHSDVTVRVYTVYYILVRCGYQHYLMLLTLIHLA